MMKLEITKPISIFFVHMAMSSPFNRKYYRNHARGAQKSMPKITQGIVSNTSIPLPPLAEQRVIVERVEKLLALVDNLEVQAKERKEQMKKLQQSVLREAFGEGKESKPVESVPFVEIYSKINREIAEPISPFQQMQIIAAVIDEVDKVNQHQGEMVIAKYIYISEFVYKIRTGFNFKKWHFGPYDPKIKKLVNNRRYFRFVGKGKYQTISLQNTEQLFSYNNQQVDLIREKFPEILKVFNNYTRPELRSYKVELLASVLKAIEDSMNSNIDFIYNEFENWKTDREQTGFCSKAEKFSRDEVKKCLEFVKGKGWIDT
jgi:type I restriction enzyme S subunit